MRLTREFHFCSGHRLLHYEGKCKHLHGHNYVARITVEGPLDDRGMVVDFDTIKATIGKWIDEQWDHAVLLHADDHVARSAMAMIPGQRVFLTVGNPTAEHMAMRLSSECVQRLGHLVQLVSVHVQETPNCSAEHVWSA